MFSSIGTHCYGNYYITGIVYDEFSKWDADLDLYTEQWPLLWTFWLLFTLYSNIQLQIGQLNSYILKTFAYFTNNQCLLSNRGPWLAKHDILSSILSINDD